MLILSRKVKEEIVIGADIRVSVVEIRGDQVKLGIVAPRSVSVYRQEVYDAIQAENVAAARPATADLPDLSPLLGEDSRNPGPTVAPDPATAPDSPPATD